MVFHFSFFIAMDGGTLSPFDIIQRKFACVHTHKDTQGGKTKNL